MFARGLTILELAAVLMVVGILSMLAIPTYDNYTSGAKNAAVRNNMKILQGALEISSLRRGAYPVDKSEAETEEGGIFTYLPGAAYPVNPYTAKSTEVQWNKGVDCTPDNFGQIFVNLNSTKDGGVIEGCGKGSELKLELIVGKGK
ncbi:MAG: type IV pilin protein [Gammaproteobacteria bacterium]